MSDNFFSTSAKKLILLLLIFASISIFVYIKTFMPDSSSPIPSQTNSISNSAVPSNTEQTQRDQEEKKRDRKIKNSSIWRKYDNVVNGFEIKYPGDWEIKDDSSYKFSIAKDACHFDLYSISSEEYVRAIEYTDGKKQTGCTLLYWWQAGDAGFALDHSKKINCSTNSSAVFYGGYYFQNGNKFFRVAMWDDKNEYFDPAIEASVSDPLKCSANFKSIAASLAFRKPEFSDNFKPESGDARKAIDADVYKIIKDFSLNMAPVQATDENILYEALSEKPNLKEKIAIVEDNFRKAKETLDNSQETARGVLNVATKICVAKGIVYNDFKHVCNLGDNSFVSLDDIDNISVGENIIPYFLAGFAYFKDGDYNRARYFLDQVKLHRRAGVMRWGESYFNSGVYAKIHDKTVKTPYPQ